MGIRRRAREIALQVLYQLDASQERAKEVLDLYWENFNERAKKDGPVKSPFCPIFVIPAKAEILMGQFI